MHRQGGERSREEQSAPSGSAVADPNERAAAAHSSAVQMQSHAHSLVADSQARVERVDSRRVKMNTAALHREMRRSTTRMAAHDEELLRARSADDDASVELDGELRSEIERMVAEGWTPEELAEVGITAEYVAALRT